MQHVWVSQEKSSLKTCRGPVDVYTSQKMSYISSLPPPSSTASETLKEITSLDFDLYISTCFTLGTSYMLLRVRYLWFLPLNNSPDLYHISLETDSEFTKIFANLFCRRPQNKSNICYLHLGINSKVSSSLRRKKSMMSWLRDVRGTDQCWQQGIHFKT